MPSLGRADALVLDLENRAGLAIARALGRGGYGVSIAATDRRASGFATRHARRRVVLPDPIEDFHACAEALIAELTEHPVDVVIPSIDASVEVVHRHRDVIGRLTAPAVCSPEALEVALSKERTLQVAGSLGMPAPRSLAASTSDEIVAAVTEVGLPCVLKPFTSWRFVGVGGERVAPVYVADMADAQRLASGLIRPEAPVLVQEFAGGMRETIKLFRHQDRTLARLAMIVDRSWPPLGGSSTMRRTTSPPEDTLRLAELLVAEIGLEGYAEVEFRRDARGRPLLMEVNPRLSQSIELATRAGVDFPRMQLEWARGGSIPHPPSPVIGLRVGWVAGDLRFLFAALTRSPPPRPRRGSTLRSIASDYLLHRARLEGLDLGDPRPVLGALAFTIRGVSTLRRR